jgi:membrane-bound lytic murein transglycosylase D
MRVNGLSGRDVIRIGQMISLPVDSRRGAVSPAEVLVRNEIAPARPAPVVADSSGNPGSYVVRNGDSIERIANRFGVSQQALIAANTIGNRNLIFPGQTLQIPGAGTSTAIASGAALAANAPPSPAPPITTAPIEQPVATLAAAALDNELPSVAADELAAALAPAVRANGEPVTAAEASNALEDATLVNALASEQADLAADPSDYSVNASNEIQVQALETLGHYADWLGIPTQRLRDLNRLEFRESVVIGRMLTLDFSRVDAATFEQRRVAYQQQRQSDFPRCRRWR